MTRIASWRRRAPLLALVAAAVLVAGYADLARGGMSVAPVLLVAAYCVAIPLAIYRGGRQP